MTFSICNKKSNVRQNVVRSFLAENIITTRNTLGLTGMCSTRNDPASLRLTTSDILFLVSTLILSAGNKDLTECFRR